MKKPKSKAITNFKGQEKAEFLKAFQANCVDDFKVTWVVHQLSRKPPLPNEICEILSLMLLAFSIWRTRARIRRSLGWHTLNSIVERVAKEKRSNNPSSDYTRNLAETLEENIEGFTSLYEPLGGFNWDDKYSRIEIHDYFKGAFTAVASSLVAANLMVCIGEKKLKVGRRGEPSLNSAKKLITAWKKQYVNKAGDSGGRKNYNRVVKAEYGLDVTALGGSQLEVNWSMCGQGIEFLASLCTLRCPSDWSPKGKSKRAALNKPGVSAYDFVRRNSYNLIPFSNEEFRKIWLARASYFSKYLTTRDGEDAKTRFAELQAEPFDLNIIDIDQFKNLET